MDCKTIAFAAAAVWACGLQPASAIEASSVTFDSGLEGWQAPTGSGGVSFITPLRGNDAPALRTHFSDFGITFSNNSSAAFVGNYGSVPAVQIGLDVKTLSIDFFGTQVTRDLVVELRDYDNVPDGVPFVSIWYDLGTLDPRKSAWQTLSVTIANTASATLPAGWGGDGSFDPVTFEPTLPANRTFADVLAGVDEIAFTTLVPGFFYDEAKFDVVVDNLFIKPLAPVPEAPTGLLLVAGLAGMAAYRRHARRT